MRQRSNRNLPGGQGDFSQMRPSDEGRSMPPEEEADDMGLGDTLDAVGAKHMGGDYLPEEVGQEFIGSEEGQNLLEIWRQEGGPTDTAVEAADQLFGIWTSKKNTVPQDLMPPQR